MRRLLPTLALLALLAGTLAGCAGSDSSGGAASLAPAKSPLVQEATGGAELESARRSALAIWSESESFPPARRLVAQLRRSEPSLSFRPDDARYRAGVMSVRVSADGQTLVLTTRTADQLIRGTLDRPGRGAAWTVTAVPAP